jgi:hypothetical protein
VRRRGRPDRALSELAARLDLHVSVHDPLITAVRGSSAAYGLRYAGRVKSRELIAWSALHERRARAGWWTSRVFVSVVAGAAIAGWVGWRETATVAAASHAWLAATLVAFAIAFMRVPFHLYWRPDAALLAQLPIEGGPLFDAALVRCIRAAAATTAAAVIGAAPFVRDSFELFVRHAAVGVTLGVAAALFMPAVATWAASLVALGQSNERVQRVRAAAGLAQTPDPPSSALLGALPGFAATLVITGILLITRWLVGGAPVLPGPIVLGSIAGASVLAILAIRASAPKVMGTILRDVSALDRQRLATLEIRQPTSIERAIARLIGDAALPYSKDARLMRRRYPMAFALGALGFIVLVIVGISQPDDPGPWLTATLAGAAAYGVVLAGRLQKPPIELHRLSNTLPISGAARARAKLAWLLGWWTIFVAAPGTFAILRQPETTQNLALLVASTLVIVVASYVVRPRR